MQHLEELCTFTSHTGTDSELTSVAASHFLNLKHEPIQVESADRLHAVKQECDSIRETDDGCLTHFVV